MLSFEFLLRLSAILKLDFLKSPGKSGSARLPRGMKLGNIREFAHAFSCAYIQSWMHLGSLESTQEARVAFGYRLVQLLRIFRALQTFRVHP